MTDGGGPKSQGGGREAGRGPVAGSIDGRVYKVIRVVATSSVSWEDAAQRGVAEAAKTITDLRSAIVTDMDTVVDEGLIRRYRLELEMVFQLDRARRRADTGEVVEVRRYLVVANQTLVSHALHELIDERLASGPAEVHVLAPRPRRAGPSRLLGTGDVEAGRVEADERLRLFRHALTARGLVVSGEVGGADPVAAIRQVLERGSFDEIIVSMLPPRRSWWSGRNSLSDLERSVPVPVTTLVHDEGDDLAACPIG